MEKPRDGGRCTPMEQNGNVRESTFADLPIVDLSLLTSDPQRVATEIAEAAAQFGFLQVVNHSVPIDVLKTHEALGRQFFNLPLEAKQRAHLGPFKGYNGFTCKPGEIEPTVTQSLSRESLAITFGDGANLEVIADLTWRDNKSEMMDIWNALREEVTKLSHQIHEFLAVGLGLSTDFFTQKHGEWVWIVWHHYPRNPSPGPQTGVRGHVDPVSLTFLCQDDVGGLQIKRQGEWLGVRPVEGAFVVNVGDVMQAWSNDNYLSVEHRVVLNSERERISFGAVFRPDPTFLISAPEELVDKDHPRKYKPFTSKELLDYASRLTLANKTASLCKLGAFVI